MPYPRKNLNPGETVALDMHPHWWFLAEPAGAVIAAIVLAILVQVEMDDGTSAKKALTWVTVVALIGAALWLVVRYLKWATTHFVITSHRLIFREGIFAKRGVEIPLERVNNVNFGQTVFERLVGAGNLLIESGGEDGQQRFTDIRHPDRVQNLIHAQVEANYQRRSGQMDGGAAGYRQPGPPPAPSRPVGDVADQLERLEGMLERGTLTPEEFAAQKRRLLDG